MVAVEIAAAAAAVVVVAADAVSIADESRIVTNAQLNDSRNW